VNSGSVTVRYGFERVLLDPVQSQAGDTGSLEMVAAIQTDGSAIVRDVGPAALSLDADVVCGKDFQLIEGGTIENLSNRDVEISATSFLSSLRVLIKNNRYRWSPPQAVVRFNAEEPRRELASSNTLVLRPGDTWRFKIYLNDPSLTVEYVGQTKPASGESFSSALESGNIRFDWSQLEYDLSSSLSSFGLMSPSITQSLRSKTVEFWTEKCGAKKKIISYW
jgi:hypothetical protein